MEIVPPGEVKPFAEVKLGSVFQATIRKHTRWCIKAQMARDFQDDVAVVLSPIDKTEDPGTAWAEYPVQDDCVLDYGNEWVCRPSLEAADVLIGRGADLSTAGALLLNPKTSRIALVDWTGEVPMVMELDGNTVVRSLSVGRIVIIKRWEILLRPNVGPSPIHLVTVVASDARAKARGAD